MQHREVYTGVRRDAATDPYAISLRLPGRRTAQTEIGRYSTWCFD
jgi:hypothetical protein